MLVRVRRRLFTFASIVSLLACLAMCMLGVRSIWTADYFLEFLSKGDPRIYTRLFHITTSRGGLRLVHYGVPQGYSDDLVAINAGWASERAVHYSYLDEGWPPGANQHRFAGFEWGRMNIVTGGSTISVTSVTFPILVPILLLAVMPFVRTRQILRDRRRARLGLCPMCGYDLRASPDRCLECGHAPVVFEG